MRSPTIIRHAALAAVFAIAAAAAPAAVHAADLPQPEGPVVLTLEGGIGVTNRDGAADFDRAMLRDVGWREIESYTDWTEGLQSFGGVPLAALLERVEADGETLHAVALNEYAAELPLADAAEHDVLLAMTRDGEPMSVREKGPIWIVYPQDEPAGELANLHNDKMVWQLRTLIVE